MEEQEQVLTMAILQKSSDVGLTKSIFLIGVRRAVSGVCWGSFKAFSLPVVTVSAGPSLEKFKNPNRVGLTQEGMQ